MSDLADTGGSPCSGWPGDATAAPQTIANEGREREDDDVSF